MTNRGIYVHIPFCDSKCEYCDFVSCVNKDNQRQYVDALIRELDIKSASCHDMTFDTIYIGGGTPSALFDGGVERIIDAIRTKYHIAKDTEITVEVNPNSFSEAKLLEYLRAGVNRVSVGVQSLSNTTLALIGRQQTKQQVDNAFALLRKYKVNNISADIMLGLPSQTMQDIYDILTYFVRQKVKHISTYMLQVEDGTPLARKVNAGTLVLPDEDETVKLYTYCVNIAKGYKYDLYEISNMSLKGYQSRHNSKYWDGTEYVGVGVASHSYVARHRLANTASIETYISKLNAGSLPIVSNEYIDDDKMRTEKIMLSLRTSKGLNLSEFTSMFGENILQTRADVIKPYLDSKALKITKGHLIITENYLAISNKIISDFL